MNPAMDPAIAHKTWRTLEPLHGIIYFAEQAQAAYADLGLEGRSGYFASRAAALGPVNAETVIATFFNFNPAVVREAMNGVWETASPEALLTARHAAASAVLTDTIGDDAISSPEIVEAADLARQAALVACEQLDGRPLFAAHAALPWPTDPHMVLWHAQTLLREFRGDGHIALLVGAGLSGIDALVLHGAMGAVPGSILQATRGWDDEAWAASVSSLVERGWIAADESFTEAGRELRDGIETRTDELALAPYAALGEESCARLRELARPYSRALAGALTFKLPES